MSDTHSKNPTNRGLRTPMHTALNGKTPSLTGQGGGTVIPGSAPKSATFIQSPNTSAKK